VQLHADAFDVATGEGVLRVTQVQRPGGKRISAAEFLHSQALSVGMVLGQAAAFHVAPELFMQRRTMETLSRTLGNVRQKYVLGVDASKVHVDIQIQQPDAGLNLGDYLEKKE
jgi:hypothetical protein